MNTKPGSCNFPYYIVKSDQTQNWPLAYCFRSESTEVDIPWQESQNNIQDKPLNK